MEQRPTAMIGALLGVLLAFPITAIFYLAESTANLPFLPADLMNWLIPFIPGDLITFGINLMVDIILALDLGREDVVAKFFETLTASAIFIGLLAGLAFVYRVYIFDFVKDRLPSPLGGVLVALVLALPLAIISDVELTGDNPFYSGRSLALRSAWNIALVLLWGALMHLAIERYMNLKDSVPENKDLKSTSSATSMDEVPSTRPLPAEIVDVPSNRPMVQKLSRRRFLVQVGGTSAAVTVIGAGLGSLLEESEAIIAAEQQDFSFQNFPNQGASVEPAPGTRPEYTPLEDHYRIDINSASPPEVDADTWRLQITGLVVAPTEFTLDQIRNDFDSMNQYVTLSCISNRIGGSLISTIGWTGVSMQDILDVVRPREDATHIRITSADGFWEYIALDLIREDRRVMLCYAWDEKLLLQKHGFPLRIYIPDRYGMKQPKWIVEMEFVNEWDEGYWVERGWSREALVQTTSVIDTVAVNEAYTDENGQSYIPVGGIAYSGDKGISKVEISLNDGEWVEAELRTPLSETTWVIWRYDWPLQEGEQRFAVRCYDGSGGLQVTEQRRNKPNGATGTHTFEASV